MIINNVDRYEFKRAFADHNRADQFSHEGFTALFEWLEELSEDTGEPYELDVIALCCAFTEYSDLAEIQDNYSGMGIVSAADLRDHTHVIEFDSGLIIQDF